MTEAPILEAPSHEKRAVTRQDILRLIPQFEIQSFLKRHHFNREIIIGLIGLRGDGKSGSGACLALVDYMFEGKPVWSNMEIRCDLEIDDQTAQKYGLNSGGTARFASEPLDKQALLQLDEQYKGGCLFIDEINVQYSNARKFMTNTNVDFNAVVQQLRKFETSLIYSVIDEMFIDTNLRSLTSVFIKSEDTAYSSESLAIHKPPGLDFKWTIYPMDGYLVGREKSYYVTKKPLAPVYFHFGVFRGIYDDKKFQHKGVYSPKFKDTNITGEMSVGPSQETVQQIDKWAWLEEKAVELRNEGILELAPWELKKHLGLSKRGLVASQSDFVGALAEVGIHRVEAKHPYYVLEDFQLGKVEGRKRGVQLL